MKRLRNEKPNPVEEALSAPSEKYAQIDYNSLKLAPHKGRPKAMNHGGADYHPGQYGPGVRAAKNARAAENRNANHMDRREALYQMIVLKMKGIIGRLRDDSYQDREFSHFRCSPQDEAGVQNIINRLVDRKDITEEEEKLLRLNLKATAWLIIDVLKKIERD